MAFYLEQKTDGTAVVKATDTSKDKSISIEFEDGAEAILGRGETDDEITYLALRNEQGELTYIYPNAAQNGVTVSGTKP